MNKLRYILILSLLLCGTAVSAQIYDRVLRNNLWIGSDNVTGIRQDTVSASYAEIFAGYERGEFRDTWQAKNGWYAGARTASVQHLEKISLAGSFSFEQTEGYEMCGSMFINPGYYPMDILEFTPGRKTLQTYTFDGGISYDVAPQWRIGAKMDFESANISKRKDLRHSNWLLDMTIAPGFMFHDGDLAVGASALFRKTSESVEAEQVGTAESSYYAFLNKGLMYGNYSVWTGSGLHLEESGVNGFPVKEISYGGAAQLQFKDFFADFRYLRTSGVAGEKEYIWFRFPGNEMGLNLRYRLSDRAANSHFMRLSVARRMQVMDESVLEKVSVNGVNTVLNHGSNRILSREIWHISPEYEFVHDVMEVKAGLNIDVQNGVTSQIYPYIYAQSLAEGSAYVGFTFHMGRLDWGVTGIYGQGWVSESERIVSEDSGVQTTPYRLQNWYDRQMEYRTAKRFCAALMLRYNLSRGFYLKMDFTTVQAYGLKYAEGSDRLNAMFTVGLDF
ncbi:MAG: hypothetical protein IKY66_10090 [Bacteroidales bacterium]|nr:hypothetical protein [Bacteroidales bacterium]